MQAKAILQEALTTFGPNGENWIKGYSVGMGKACAIHTCWMIDHSHPDPSNSEFVKAIDILTKVLPGNASSNVGFNDAATTTFPDIKAWFERAIAEV